MTGKVTNNEGLNDVFVNFRVISIDYFGFPNPLIKEKWNKNIFLLSSGCK